MLLFDKIIAGVRCGVWCCTESIEQMAGCLPNGEALLAEACGRFKSSSRQMEWVAVRTLLYFMLGKVAEIDYVSTGAPILSGTDLNISISHTGKYVCVALSDTEQVGVDVERYSDRVEKIRSRFVGEDEQAESLVQLLTLWSAKEAVFKLIQKEGVDFKENLKSYPYNQETCGDFIITYKAQGESIDCCVAYEMHDDFVLTLAKYMS